MTKWFESSLLLIFTEICSLKLDIYWDTREFEINSGRFKMKRRVFPRTEKNM